MVACQCVWTKQPHLLCRGLCRASYYCSGGRTRIIRGGSGAGDATGLTPGQAHEFASKAAETDATKRALSTFGNAFGLSLYKGPTEPSPSQPNPLNGSSATPTPLAASLKPLHVFSEYPPTSVKAPPCVDKSMLPRSEPKRLRDLDHLKFVANQPCLTCGRQPSHAHHLTFTQPNALGRKVSDEFTVPLCNLHRRELHDHGNERTWWIDRKVNPLPLARELWTRSHGWSLPSDCRADAFRSD